eukprot:scaffold8302_cov51-Phaeocystis_antarctica.AAC.1
MLLLLLLAAAARSTVRLVARLAITRRAAALTSLTSLTSLSSLSSRSSLSPPPAPLAPPLLRALTPAHNPRLPLGIERVEPRRVRRTDRTARLLCLHQRVDRRLDGRDPRVPPSAAPCSRPARDGGATEAPPRLRVRARVRVRVRARARVRARVRVRVRARVRARGRVSISARPRPKTTSRGAATPSAP